MTFNDDTAVVYVTDGGGGRHIGGWAAQASGVPGVKAYHQVLDELEDQLTRAGKNLRDPQEIVDMLEESYKRWGGEQFGEAVWHSARKWLESTGHLP